MTFGTCGQQLIRTEFSPRVSFLMDKMSNSSLLIVQFLMNGSQGGQKSRLLKILLLLGSNKGHFKMISSEDHKYCKIRTLFWAVSTATIL